MLGHSLHPIILNLLLKRLLRLWLNRINTKPVTCSKGPKVPSAVTRHILRKSALKFIDLTFFYLILLNVGDHLAI